MSDRHDKRHRYADEQEKRERKQSKRDLNSEEGYERERRKRKEDRRIKDDRRSKPKREEQEKRRRSEDRRTGDDRSTKRPKVKNEKIEVSHINDPPLGEQLDRLVQDQMEKWKMAALVQRRRKQEREKGIVMDEGKHWSLDDDVDGEPLGHSTPMLGTQEVDPLDAFMSSLNVPPICKEEQQHTTTEKVDETEESDIEEADDLCMAGEEIKQSKIEKLKPADYYPPFKKSFYIESKEMEKMTTEEVAAYRKVLDLRARGKDVPKPIKAWDQAGLTEKALEMIKHAGYDKPMPIQAQAIPVIMSGRDCIGIARTGSGKTMAYVLPMLRHVMNQERLAPGDGPIAIVMAPTRELVTQIHSVVNKFAKAFGKQTVVAAYGGSAVQNQINSLKRGAEIVVCTPGRMIDMLCMSGGHITNLNRLTFLVMDEADRMFDLGFEPQINRIVQNSRPDRQTVLFSATFPVSVEVLARKVLHNPVDIHIGGRSMVNKDISQTVEIHNDDEERFKRLLELLGQWHDKGKILVFVNTQDKCDSLYMDLRIANYRCLSLHGGKDQSDRESTIADFKSGKYNVLVATSVAARGLDVQELELVINYDVPNHYEEYVHRVGRTGRAGRKGTAVTFISNGEERYAADLIKALKGSGQTVPDDLKAMANSFSSKVDEHAEVKYYGRGYGGHGHKFNAEEEEARKAAKKAQAKEYGFGDDESDDEIEADSRGLTTSKVAAPPLAAAGAVALATARVAAIVASFTNLKGGNDGVHEIMVEINDLPQSTRQHLTRKDVLERVREETGALVTVKGEFVPLGKPPLPGVRKLYMLIKGETEVEVRRAHTDILKEMRSM